MHAFRWIACLIAVFCTSLLAQEPPADAPAQAPGQKQFMLPAPVDSVTPAGGGRFLLLQMNKLLKLGIFDVTQDKIVGYIPLASSDIVTAGGMNKVVLIARDKNVVQRWNIDPLQKELTIAIDESAAIDSMVMGHASEGPMLVMTRGGPRFYSLQSLKPMEINATIARGGEWLPHPQHPILAAASADGQTFAGWARSLSPSGVRIMRLQGDTIASRSAHESAGVLLPSFDGTLLFTSIGIYSSDLTRIAAEQFQGKQCIPSYHPSYFLAVGTPADHGSPSNPRTAAIYSTSDRALLVDLGPIEELGAAQQRGYVQSVLALHERIFLIPQHNRMLIIPETRDRVHIRPFDIIDALNKAGIDYLFVDSLPTTTVEPGGTYRYPIQVKSKAGGVRFTLDSGPEGMELEQDGTLSWDVPPDYSATAPFGVIITIEDASGQSIFHTFNLANAASSAATQPTQAQ